MTRKWWLITLVAVVLGAVVVNAQFSRDFSREFLSSPAGQALVQVYGTLTSNYLTDIDSDAIIEGAIRGMLEALDDPYTSYSDPEEAARANQDRLGQFEGIGATLQARNRATQTTVEVVNVFRDSPAWQAGIQRGDIFVEIDGQNVEQTPINEIVRMVRGPRGTVVELGMLRPGVEGLVRFSVVRDTINIISAESTVLADNVGYLRLTTFAHQRVYDQMREQLTALQAQGISSLILDLRDNGGGLLNQGVMVADTFLSEGDIVFQRARGVTQRFAFASPEWLDLPMVVLVNRNSASASEIVAGALQDNQRALVIGEETFGKGVGQSVVSLANGGQLTYLSFEWLTPSRRSINQQGIAPDVPVKDTRLSEVITLEGRGAAPGAEIEIRVNGEVIGTSVVDEQGGFTFFQSVPRGPASEVQGQAIVDLENDPVLQVAIDTLLGVVAQSR